MALTEAELKRIYDEMDTVRRFPLNSTPSAVALKYRGKTDEEVRAIFAADDAAWNASIEARKAQLDAQKK